MELTCSQHAYERAARRFNLVSPADAEDFFRRQVQYATRTRMRRGNLVVQGPDATLVARPRQRDEPWHIVTCYATQPPRHQIEGLRLMRTGPDYGSRKARKRRRKRLRQGKKVAGYYALPSSFSLKRERSRNNGDNNGDNGEAGISA